MRVLFPLTARRAALSFLISVLIDQNYGAVVVILLTFKSSTERDIFVPPLEYIFFKLDLEPFSGQSFRPVLFVFAEHVYLVNYQSVTHTRNVGKSL